jgi:hypothetical protein
MADDQCPTTVGQPFDHPPQRRAEQPGLMLDKIGVNPRISSIEAPLPAAFAASRHRSSTPDRSLVSVVIGILS